jgi:transcriptional regulator with XRE-family HTH domain
VRNFLKQLREARKVKLRELAEKTGYGVSTINNFENGTTDASEEFLKKIAEALGVSVDEVLNPPRGFLSSEEAKEIYGSKFFYTEVFNTPHLEQSLIECVKALPRAQPEQREMILTNIKLLSQELLTREKSMPSQVPRAPEEQVKEHEQQPGAKIEGISPRVAKVAAIGLEEDVAEIQRRSKSGPSHKAASPTGSKSAPARGTDQRQTKQSEAQGRVRERSAAESHEKS